MAEFYSAELSQKINRGMQESAYKHNSVGGAIPLGYKSVNNKLVIDEKTAPIVREAFERYADGESVADICRLFNSRGYRTSKGARFGKSSFSLIFKNERYIGVYKYHDYRAEEAIPPIIDKDLWDRVQARMKKVSRAPGRNKAKRVSLIFLPRYYITGVCRNHLGTFFGGDNCVTGNYPLNELLIDITFVTLLVLVLLAIALIVGVPVHVGAAVHVFSTMTAEQLSRKQVMATLD